MSGPTLSETLIASIAILTPFITLIAVCGLLFNARTRRNALLHETLRAMIDKGVAIPPELITPPIPVTDRRANSDLRSGLVMLAFGLGVILLLGVLHSRLWPIGFIFVLIGGALLLTSKLDKKHGTGNIDAMPK